MPNIFSVSGSFFGTASFYNSAIWQGGIIPTASDTIFIRGCRTTLANQNSQSPGPGGTPGSAGLMYWPGTASFVRVGDTAGFPPTGSFFTYTERNVEVKIDYEGISGSFYFVNCKVDRTFSAPWGTSASAFSHDSPLTDKAGGAIPVGAFLQFRPGLIQLTGSQTASIWQTFVENGGGFELRDTSSYYIGNYTIVRDGRLSARDRSTFYWNNTYTTSSSATNQNDSISWSAYMEFADFPLQQVTIEGAELRTNTTMSFSSSIGDHFISVANASSFEKDDWIFIGPENYTSSRTDDNFTQSFSGERNFNDEAVYVLSKDTGSTPNRLFVIPMNGLQGSVFATASSTEIIVDEERYQVGDKISINGQLRTITEVTSSFDYLLKDYNFQSGATLAEWESEPTRSQFHANWAVAPGFGLTCHQTQSAAQYRQATVKSIYRDNIKVEAFISNYMQITASNTDSGSRSSNVLGIFIQDEVFAPDIGLNYGLERAYLAVNPTNRTAYLMAKQNNDGIQQLLLPRLGVTNTEGLLKYTLECTQGLTRGYINDVLVQESVNRSGVYAGRVGVWTTNPKFICTRFIVYAKCQKIKLDSPVTGVKANDIVYEVGLENNHIPGEKVIKLASKIIDPMSFYNLAYAYRGFDFERNDGSFPYIWSKNNDGTARSGSSDSNSSTITGFPLINNFSSSARTNNGEGVGASFTFDLMIPTTFNNFGFIERFYYQQQTFTSSVGIQISGSNDSFTWVPLTSSIIDPRGRTATSTIRSYPLSSPVTYRWVRLQMNGITNAGNPTFDRANDLTAFILRNITGSNQITVNNSSDLNVGDTINIVDRSISSFYPYIASQYNRAVFSGSTSLLEDPNEGFIITAKTGSILQLNKPIQNIVQKDAFVLKLNRNINFSGSYLLNGAFAPAGMKPGKIFFNTRTQLGNKLSFKNVGIQHLSDEFPFTSQQFIGPIKLNYFNFWTPLIFQGCSFYNGGNNGGNGPLTQQTNIHVFWRHNSIFHYNYGGIQGAYNTSVAGAPWLFTGNFFNSNGGYYTYGTGYNLNSYNVYQNSQNFAGMAMNTQLDIRQSINQATGNGIVGIHGGYAKVVRNLMRFNGYAYSLLNSSVSPTEGLTLFEYKNNLVENTQDSYGGYGGFREGVIDRLLLPARGGNDNYRIHVRGSNFGMVGLTSLTFGIPSNYMRDYNRYKYDVWTSGLGWIIKYPNDSWYRHYNFAWQNTKQPLYQAAIHIMEDTTCSFDVSFDYYHDNSQYAFSNTSYPFNLSQEAGINVPNREDFAGPLFMYVLKDGAQILPSRILPKTLSPTNYSERFILPGKGAYNIVLSTINPVGYVALRNISSTFNAPDSEYILVRHNSFTMKYLENRIDKLQVRTNPNSYTNPSPKFRLKGAKLF